MDEGADLLVAGHAVEERFAAHDLDQRGTRRTLVQWIVPGLTYSLRSESTMHDPRSLRVTYAERREMVSCRQMRWSQA